MKTEEPRGKKRKTKGSVVTKKTKETGKNKNVSKKRAHTVTSEINTFHMAAGKNKATKKKMTQGVSNEAKEALLRRKGDALVKQHGHGCRHYGILDLPSMSQKRRVDYYCQEGRWLHGTSCLGCNAKTTDLTPQKGSGIIVYYCEMGIKACSIDAVKEQAQYKAHTCNCILCPDCHAQQLDKHQQEGKNGPTGRVSRRKKGGLTPIYNKN